jgi:SAM-dependent methyltransferase
MGPAAGIGLPARGCDACGETALVPFCDLGDVPVECGRHWATRAEAVASPVGRVVLGHCPECGYVRNLAFDESLVDPAAPTDMNLYHSPTFRAFSSALVAELAAGSALAGRRVLEIGCAQGEFLRELCRVGGCTGVGYDPSYEGPEGVDPSGAELRRGPAPLAGELPPFDLLVSRFVLEHVTDPYRFLTRLRELAGDRPVTGHLQVPDAGYDLATAGWEVIYPHVSYFGASALCRIAGRAGWRVEATAPVFAGLIRRLDLSTGDPTAPAGVPATEVSAARDQLLAAVAGFDERHHAERRRWRETVGRLADSGARPVLWGAGSRGVQLLNFADPDRRFTAVVDVNPAKWGRYLPVTGHRVDAPDRLRGSGTRAVVITNPVYRDEIARSLADLGVRAEILVA